MCGRFTQHFTWKELVELYNLTRLDNAPNLQPRSDIRPTTDIVIVREKDEDREAATVRWWLVPPWAKELSQKYAMFNARAETLTQRKAFAGPFKKRRCLIPASGFYEWKDEGGPRKTRYYITSKSGQPLTFAGLWEHNPHLELDSCTIIVTEPNALMAEIHDRMPVILPPEAHDVWLTEPREDLLQPAPDGDLIAYPVAPDIQDDDTVSRLQPPKGQAS
ncbi:SOS response-associated peptidase [Fodinicurvata fenggangensis]|uniref:SOS response-associated peptidase n=1 Tax=Fodinicurvata fenggangensis TaxID=1121830 RepID=UPI00047CBCE0|nr:SOS response-associated peptidase [Fodinicurvata fenggangensis]